jgi:hypothetical protein
VIQEYKAESDREKKQVLSAVKLRTKIVKKEDGLFQLDKVQDLFGDGRRF